MYSLTIASMKIMKKNTSREVGGKLGKYAIGKFGFELSPFLCLREDSNCSYRLELMGTFRNKAPNLGG